MCEVVTKVFLVSFYHLHRLKIKEVSKKSVTLVEELSTERNPVRWPNRSVVMWCGWKIMKNHTGLMQIRKGKGNSEDSVFSCGIKYQGWYSETVYYYANMFQFRCPHLNLDGTVRYSFPLSAPPPHFYVEFVMNF